MGDDLSQCYEACLKNEHSHLDWHCFCRLKKAMPITLTIILRTISSSDIKNGKSTNDNGFMNFNSHHDNKIKSGIIILEFVFGIEKLTGIINEIYNSGKS